MVELLAPAGSWEALVAAVQAGADAVYLGGKAFGARHYAANFDNEELEKAVKYAHLRNVRIFVTVNTLLDDTEYEQLKTYLLFLDSIGVDAIIVQDIGVLTVARKIVPNLNIHASTQMTIMNSDGVKLLSEEGVTRVVLAREVSLENIKNICAASPIEIEVFIHGALCVCYSGQCLMSSLIGGRSGNRGRCAQPCRLPYSLVNAKGENVLREIDAGDYLLSPRDFKTIELIPQLIEAGVHSLKIEGRMKRPEYVAVVVDAYRKAIDSYYAGKFSIAKSVDKDLAQIFNRDFTTAYLLTKQGRFMMSDRRPNNRGVRLGRVVEYNSQQKVVTIKLDDELNIGDGIEFWVKVGGRVGITVNEMFVNNNKVTHAEKGDEVTIGLTSPVKVNDRVFKTMSEPLTKRAQEFFMNNERGRIKVNALVAASIGNPLSIKFIDENGNVGCGKTEFIAQEALKRPLSFETIYKQINRLGGTDFVLDKLECCIDGNVMVPVSEINEARRKAIQDLENHILKAYIDNYRVKNVLPVVTSEELSHPFFKPKKPLLCVNIDELSKVKAALKGGADIVLFGGENLKHQPITFSDYEKSLELVRRNNKIIIFSLPRITHEHQLDSLYDMMKKFSELKPDGVSVQNLGALHVARNYNLPIYADYPLNIYNSNAVRYMKNLGIQSVTLSPELNLVQITNIADKADVHLECIVHGWLTMMISEYCILGSFLGDLHKGTCPGVCRNERYFLRDRMNELFPIATDQYCRMHVLNAKELSMMTQIDKLLKLGLSSLRFEAKMYEANEVMHLTDIYRKLIDSRLDINDVKSEENEQITRGHYYRGVM